jgi:DNA ligase-1
MKYEELYSIDKAGKIRKFVCEILDTEDEHSNENSFLTIVTATGLLDGKLVSKPTKVSKGYQNRTIRQQAELQANGLINEKKYEGYKTIDMLRERLHHRDFNVTVDNIKWVFEKLNITYNTNPDWYPLPMLAEKWKDHKKKVKYPVLVQPKLNGVRCLAFWCDKRNEVLLMSRGGIYYAVPHIALDLRNFLSEHKHIILDGELYKHNVPLQQISGAVRTENDQIDIFGGKQNFIEYWVYDHIFKDRHHELQESRERNRKQTMMFFDKIDSKIKNVPTSDAISEEQVITLHNYYTSSGFEGAIVRATDAIYMPGFRDKCLLKVKEFIDEEFNIVSYEYNKDKGPESFVFILRDDDGRIFKARPTGTLEQKEWWYKNFNLIVGHKATVRYQEKSEDGIPMQGHVRHKDSRILIENIRPDYQ